MVPLRSEKLARDLLELLTSYGPEFTPTRMGERQTLREKFDLSKAIEMWIKDDSLWIAFEADPYETRIVVDRFKDRARPFDGISVSIDQSYFQSEQNTQKFIDLAKSLYSLLSAACGNCMHYREWEAKHYLDFVDREGNVIGKKTTSALPERGLVDVFWANFFGPPYVDFFGEERVLTAPCHRRERLPDGGFMLLTSPSPLHYDRPETKEIERALKDHLDNDAFIDQSNPKKKTRKPLFPPPKHEEGIAFRWFDETGFIGKEQLKRKKPTVYDKAKYHDETVVMEHGLPEEQSSVHTAFYLGWIIDNDLYSDMLRRESPQIIEEFKARKITAIEAYERWDRCLDEYMLTDEGNDFSQAYFDFKKGQYLDDYEELLSGDLPSMYHVKYTWENYDIIKERIDERYRKWKAAKKTKRWQLWK